MRVPLAEIVGHCNPFQPLGLEELPKHVLKHIYLHSESIKMLSSQPDDGSVDAERLLREVQICRKITHPNVVRVFDLGRHEGSIFIIMELLEGQVLVDLIHETIPEGQPDQRAE